MKTLYQFKTAAYVLGLCIAPLVHAGCDSKVPSFVEKIQTQIIIVGEVHGTQEMPAFAEKLACYYAKKNIPVLLGLELSSDEQPYLNAYHFSNGLAQDKEKLFGASFWERGGRTGQASSAVFNLMEHARKLAHDGYVVLPFFYGMSGDVIALGNNKEDFNINNDLVMAANVYARAINYKAYKLIILSGNRHARKADELYSMASFLEKFAPVFSINFAYQGGKIWGCEGAPMTCGISTIRPSLNQQQAGFDAIAELGELHPAPPAIAK